MKVSVLVPVYGVEKYIAVCAESLFAQTYEDIEYIFCDDCTPDGSIEVLREVMQRYPERQNAVRIIRNSRNIGLGGTRKHLISEMKGDAFVIVDSDDFLTKNAVELLVRRMEETDADIIDSAYRTYSDGKEGAVSLPSHADTDAFFKKALCQNLVSLRVWGKLYKASVVEKVPRLFIEGVDFAEDLCASSRLIGVTHREWIDDVTYLYRTDNMVSYSNNISEKNLLSYFRAMSVVLEFYHLRGHLPLALEIGLLNVYRECRRSGIPTQKADEIMGYVAEHFPAQLLLGMLRNKAIPLSITDALYRAVRWLAC